MRCDKYRYRSTSESQRHLASSPAIPAQNSCTIPPDETAPADGPTIKKAHSPMKRSSATAAERRDTGSYSRALDREACVSLPPSNRPAIAPARRIERTPAAHNCAPQHLAAPPTAEQ